MRQEWQPDIVVGIDFGMTCTGVAWSMGPEWSAPKTLQHWPGKLGHELRNKVDTSIAYDIATRQVKAWGFLADPDDEKCEFNELFKLYLDPTYCEQDPFGNAPAVDEARMWFRDYLSCLYQCLKRHFENSFAHFASKRVEYVFSCPTTWKDAAMIAETEKCIKEAGFGRSNNENASVYLTEEEAAAVFASKQSMEAGDVFLVCDAGGGTTDLNTLKVASANPGSMNLIPLNWTEGKAVGSTLIDFKLQRIILERLQRMRPGLMDDLDAAATRMVQEQFIPFKCSFGDEAFGQPVDLHLSIPGMLPNQDFPDAHIKGSKLIVRANEIRNLFDEQVDKLFGLIDEQLSLVQSRHPRESIGFLVLSGGLGSSPYVQQRLRAQYDKDNAGGKFKCARNMKLLIAGEPQLAVVHGLVIARTQPCRGGKELLSKRCSPVSYGIICREIYDDSKHRGQEVVQDSNDNRMWVENRIAWIVQRGQIFDAETGASQTYQMKLDIGEEKVPWKARIAMSTLPAEQLPESITKDEDAARVICEVEFTLDARDFKMKNRHWYQLKQPYYTGVFEVRLLVGTGLRFEIWSKARDRLLSKQHDEIQVAWVAPDEVPTAVKAHDGSRMYRVE